MSFLQLRHDPLVCNSFSLLPCQPTGPFGASFQADMIPPVSCTRHPARTQSLCMSCLLPATLSVSLELPSTRTGPLHSVASVLLLRHDPWIGASLPPTQSVSFKLPSARTRPLQSVFSSDRIRGMRLLSARYPINQVRAPFSLDPFDLLRAPFNSDMIPWYELPSVCFPVSPS